MTFGHVNSFQERGVSYTVISPICHVVQLCSLICVFLLYKVVHNLKMQVLVLKFFDI